MDSKKILSVCTKEMITEGLSGSCMVLAGVLYLFFEANLWTTLISGILLLGVLISLFANRMKSEPWDEMTKEHYAKARSMTLNGTEIVLLLLGIFLLLLKSEFLFNAGTLLFLVGCLKCVRTVCFLKIEHAGTVRE